MNVPDAPAGLATAPGILDLDGLPGVAAAVEQARSAIAAVRRLPANRRGWPRTAAAAAVRAARASAMLDGGSAAVARESDGAEPPALGDGVTADSPGRSGGAVVTDPVLAGALRANAAIGELAAVWRRAPLQALARLHTLAAADLAGASDLGRPRRAAGLTQRLAALAEVAARSPWSGPVMVAVVHGELLALRPFEAANGVVARAAARLAMVSTGLDPQALTVPEVGHLRSGSEYGLAASGFASGDPRRLGAWIEHVCRALQAGSREAGSIARAAGT